MAFTRVGYGQVELNHVGAQSNKGDIFASLPLAKEVNVLQNGEFMFYNGVTGEVSKTGLGEPFLVYNEIKLYADEYRESLKDFAMIRVGDNYVNSNLQTENYGENSNLASSYSDTSGYRMDGIAPRLFKTNIGDTYTTNMVNKEGTYAVGNLLQPEVDATSKTLVLNNASSEDISTLTGMVWAVTKVYTMPDGQAGLKIQRVQ